MKLNILTTRRFVTTVGCLFVIALSSVASASGQHHHKHRNSIYGLKTIESSFSAGETSQRLQAAILSRGLTVMAVIDHAANAANVGMELRPTTLILWGNAAVGTQIMQSAQTVGIDAPLKFLVWETEDGDVLISYNTAGFMKHRHRVHNKDEFFDLIAGALAGISAGAAGVVE